MVKRSRRDDLHTHTNQMKVTSAIALLLVAAPLLVSCSSESSKPNANNSNLPFSEKRELLAKYRSSEEMCSSEDGNCMYWTNLALHCERQLAGEQTDYEKPCSAAEDLRERVTGINLASAPGAYDF